MASFVDELVRGYADLRRYLRRELTAEDAADVAQSSFEHALRYGRQHDVKSPAALMFSIARNLQVDRARRKARVLWQSTDDDDAVLDQFARTDLTPERQHSSLSGRAGCG